MSTAASKRFVIGIDEAGRGPLAGPVAVGVVAVPIGFDWSLLPGVGDSKRVTKKRRAIIAAAAAELKQQKQLMYAVTFSTAATIDAKGITFAISDGIARALREIKVDPTEATVRLDGSLRAPVEYRDQETIIQGDATVLEIGLASILAKEARDAYMRKLSVLPEYAVYDFAAHKGYGTALHRSIIKKIGPSPEHRLSFCRSCLPR
jgi:ribonuclease HII